MALTSCCSIIFLLKGVTYLKDSALIDIEKMNKLAKDLGIKVTKNSSSPGIYLTKNGKRKKMDAVSLLMAIFPELKRDIDDIEKRDEVH